MTNNNILIVDDSEFDRNVLVEGLRQKGGFKTFYAENDKQCFKILNKNNINLILMDIMMPGKLGSEILEKIRETHNSLELPIIMVTSKGDASDVIECLQKGANDYIKKPVHFEIAVTRISTHLRLAELSREMTKLKKIEALNAMITTYNHEINNPLTIAINCLENSEINKTELGKKLNTALWRIADIVKKIGNIGEKNEIELEQYTANTKMIKIQKALKSKNS
ncbi:hybrid sensor histidine kinase/response regulator [Fluviispira vulneris]|uniref:hybrid sensor histidine kinase/response regulator n=1 Tax=Fluviispira vulneris TaxID=2763012 RepID=UPI00164529C0|nr:hybrid sensor histidine kinase/response regulator [Fluviispira vulneris]